MSDDPLPTQQDIDNAETRRLIAERQEAEYAEALILALGHLGPGYTPWMRLSLLDSDHRQNGNRTPAAVAVKVYRGEHRLTENSVFLRRMPDGTVKSAKRYEELFPELHEPHPTKTLTLLNGQVVPAPRWELCWSALERYTPKTASELATLRVSRERGKAEQEEKKWAEENPLLAWGQRVEDQCTPAKEGRDR